MKKLEDLGLRIPEILLPKNIDLSTWSVIACDQYTQDKDYWKNVEEKAGNKPSTLNLILPEVYLGSPDKADRIKKIRQSMKEYLDTGVLQMQRNALYTLKEKLLLVEQERALLLRLIWKPMNGNLLVRQIFVQPKLQL